MPHLTECRLPRTASRRGAIAWAILLDRVDARARDGFGFHGKRLKPGSLIDDAELEKGRGRNAVLLESTDIEGPRGARDRRQWERLYILWRWDREEGWRELARCQSMSTDWAEVLREPARIALGRESWSIVPKVADVASRIRALLDAELDPLEPGHRVAVMAELHNQFAARLVEDVA